MDIERPEELIPGLRDRGALAHDEKARCRLLEGGVSNRTVLLERPDGGGDWVLKQALEKLRVAVDWHASPARIHREAAGMRALGELLRPCEVPRFLFEDHEHHVLAMTAVAQPHSGWRDDLLAGRVDGALARAYGDMLGRMHAGSAAEPGRFASAFADSSFFESLRLEPYYRYTAALVPAASAFLTALCARTLATRDCLVHGDYSPKNVLVHDGRLVLLDHEVIHWGDPAFDVGFCLTHLIAKANHLRARGADFARAARAAWDAYAAARGAAADAHFQARCGEHLVACLLARVDGRSPLGYLDEPARVRQRAMALALIRHATRAAHARAHRRRHRRPGEWTLMPAIAELSALEILDSRGRPTLKARVRPAERRQRNGQRAPLGRLHRVRRGARVKATAIRATAGLGCRRAAAACGEGHLPRAQGPLIRGRRQRPGPALDDALIALDGTPSKRRPGRQCPARGVAGVGRAAVASERGLPLYRHFAGSAWPPWIASPAAPDHQPVQRRQARRRPSGDPGRAGGADRSRHHRRQPERRLRGLPRRGGPDRHHLPPGACCAPTRAAWPRRRRTP